MHASCHNQDIAQDHGKQMHALYLSLAICTLLCTHKQWKLVKTVMHHNYDLNHAVEKINVLL